MKLYLGKRTIAGLAASVVVVIIVIWAAWLAVVRLDEIRGRVARTHEVLTQLSDTLSDLQDVETGGRGFVITGEEKFLEPYQTALQKVEAGVARLESLITDQPGQSLRVDRLKTYIAARIASAKENVAVRREKGFAAAQQLIHAGKGKEAMDSLRAVVTEMNEEEHRLLAQRRGEATAAALRVYVAFMLAGVAILGLLVAIGYLINRDLATRKLAEAALREKEQILSESQRIAHIGGWYWDLAGPIKWTEETYRVYGVAPETFTLNGENFLNLIHPEDRPAMQRWVAACAAGEKPGELEFKALLPDGSVRILNGRGERVSAAGHQPAIMAGTVQDITARKQAEAALRESEARLRLAAEAANVGLWDWELKTNAVFFSPEWKRQIGYRDDEIPNDFSEWQRRVHPDDLEPTQQKVSAFLANPVGRHEAEFRLRHKDGSYRWIYTHADVVRDAAGKPTRMLGCHIDITARKQAEEALRALAARLQAVREEERTGIARELHDELGQALTGLKFDLSWLDRKLGGAGAAALREKAAAMTQAVDATIQTVRRISSELRPGVLDTLGLVAAVEWQAQEFEKRTGIRCAAALPEPPPALDGARSTALFRIFQEALTNVARHADAQRVDVTLAERAGIVELQIADNGRGIADVNVAGTKSLGLLGMRERAAAAGGTMELRSAAGQGTTVIVRVPKS